jgi:hypothetical protein
MPRPRLTLGRRRAGRIAAADCARSFRRRGLDLAEQDHESPTVEHRAPRQEPRPLRRFEMGQLGVVGCRYPSPADRLRARRTEVPIHIASEKRALRARQSRRFLWRSGCVERGASRRWRIVQRWQSRH